MMPNSSHRIKSPFTDAAITAFSFTLNIHDRILARLDNLEHGKVVLNFGFENLIAIPRRLRIVIALCLSYHPALSQFHCR
jgi:hypothetical protein